MEWMDELQTGDKIIAIARSTKYLRTVLMVTDDFVELTNGDIFRKSDGYFVKQTPNNNLHIVKPNKAEIDFVECLERKRSLIKYIKKIKLSELPLEQLVDIVEIIHRSKK